MLAAKVSRVNARRVLAVMVGTEWAIGAFGSEGQAERQTTFASVDELAYGKKEGGGAVAIRQIPKLVNEAGNPIDG